MIYTTDKYTLNIEVCHFKYDVADSHADSHNNGTYIFITLFHGLDTYVCRKNIKDIIGFDVIARSVDNFVNYINKIMTTNELLVSFNAVEKVFTLSFVISNGIVDDTYSFDCIYDTISNKNNKEVRLLKTINDLSNINNLSSDKLNLNINIIALLLKNNNMDINNIMTSLSIDINLISSMDIDIILSLKSGINSTLLMFATENGNHEIVTYLVKHGADINLKNNIGKTALMYAAQKCNIEVVTYLIEHGAEINLKDNNGNTALMYAAEHGNIEIVTYLVDHNADINLKDNFGTTALIFAAQNGNIEIVTYLVEHNAEINLKNNNIKMLLQRAVDTNNITLLKALINQM